MVMLLCFVLCLKLAAQNLGGGLAKGLVGVW